MVFHSSCSNQVAEKMVQKREEKKKMWMKHTESKIHPHILMKNEDANGKNDEKKIMTD